MRSLSLSLSLTHTHTHTHTDTYTQKIASFGEDVDKFESGALLVEYKMICYNITNFVYLLLFDYPCFHQVIYFAQNY